MWFLLLGNMGYYDLLGYVINKCPDCGSATAFAVEQERKKLTVFLVPTFRYSSKQYMTCAACRQRFEVADELKPQLARKLMTEKQVKTALEEKQAKKLATLPRCPGCDEILTKRMNFCPQCGLKFNYHD